MKKHDEGYTIPLVLVVMVIMILVASLVLANSLQTAQNQQEAILQMKDKYAAEGKIEILVAQLMNSNGFADLVAESENKAVKAVVESICDGIYETENTTKFIKSMPAAEDEFKLTTAESSDISEFEYRFIVTSQYGNVKIETQILYKGKIAQSGTKFSITPSELTYETYQIGGATE